MVAYGRRTRRSRASVLSPAGKRSFESEIVCGGSPPVWKVSDRVSVRARTASSWDGWAPFSWKPDEGRLRLDQIRAQKKITAGQAKILTLEQKKDSSARGPRRTTSRYRREVDSSSNARLAWDVLASVAWSQNRITLALISVGNEGSDITSEGEDDGELVWR